MTKSYSTLIGGISRSRVEWLRCLGENLFDSVLKIGALQEVQGLSLDGFLGKFDLGFGEQNYELHIDDGQILATPIAGGHTVKIDATAGIVYSAHPEILIKKILIANGCSQIEVIEDFKGSVGTGVREVGRKKFKVILLLDENWLSSFGSEGFVQDLAKDAESLVLVSENSQRSFPWKVERKVALRTHVIPSEMQLWKIPVDWFCHPDFGTQTEEVAKVFSDIPIVFDEHSRRVFILQKELDIKADSRPYKYIKGLLNMGIDRMSVEQFAIDHLNEHATPANIAVNQGKASLKRAIEKVLAPEEQQLIMALIDPKNPKDLTVGHNIKEKDFLFWPTNSP